MDAEVVLKRFNNHPSEQDEASKLGQHGDGDSWMQLRKIFDAAVADKAKVEAQQLKASLHSLQVQNELLHHENDGLTASLEAKKKHKKKSTTMDLQQGKDYHGGAHFWSPRKIHEARARDAVKKDEAEQLRLQKSHDRDLKAAATLYKKKLQEAAKVARQEAKEQRDRERKARAEELAASRALKKQQREAATPKKSHDTPSIPKRKASRAPASNPTKRRRVVVARSGVDAVPPAAPAPPKKTSSGRQIRAPKKFE